MEKKRFLIGYQAEVGHMVEEVGEIAAGDIKDLSIVKCGCTGNLLARCVSGRADACRSQKMCADT